MPFSSAGGLQNGAVSSGPSITSLLRKIPAPVRHRVQQALHNRGYDLVPAGQATPVESPTLSLLRCGLGHLTAVSEERHVPVTELLYSRLSQESFDLLPSVLSEVEKAAMESYPDAHRMREALRLGTARLPEFFTRDTGLSLFEPPAHVHAMVRSSEFVGDQYYCDLVASALERVGAGFRTGGSYLDFGSSSGRVVRTLATAFPDASFLGCDPNADAIEWASNHVPSVDFFVSSTVPPLESIADQSLDGVYAISIWSHYSNAAGRRWIEEMGRVVKPGGHLVLTTHGLGSLLHYLDRAILSEELVTELTDGVLADGHAFYESFGTDGDWGVTDTDWGDSFTHPAFLAQHMLEGWSLLSYQTRRAEGNQDVYVLERRP